MSNPALFQHGNSSRTSDHVLQPNSTLDTAPGVTFAAVEPVRVFAADSHQQSPAPQAGDPDDLTLDHVIHRVPLRDIRLVAGLAMASNTTSSEQQDDRHSGHSRQRSDPPPPLAVLQDDYAMPGLVSESGSEDSDSEDEPVGTGERPDNALRESDEDLPNLLDVSDSSDEGSEDDEDEDDDEDADILDVSDSSSDEEAVWPLELVNPVSDQLLRHAEAPPAAARRPAQLLAHIVFNGLPDEGVNDAKRAEELMRGLEPVSAGLMKRYLRAAGDDAEIMCAVCREDLVVEDDREPLSSIPDLSSPLETRDRAETPLPTPSSTMLNAGPPLPFVQPIPPATSAEVLALPCRHAFHAGCLHPWLSRRTTCPTCRLDLDPESLTLSLPAVAVQDEDRFAADLLSTGLVNAFLAHHQEREPLLPPPPVRVRAAGPVELLPPLSMSRPPRVLHTVPRSATDDDMLRQLEAAHLGLLGSPDLPERPLAPSGTADSPLEVPLHTRARAATPPLRGAANEPPTLAAPDAAGRSPTGSFPAPPPLRRAFVAQDVESIIAQEEVDAQYDLPTRALETSQRLFGPAAGAVRSDLAAGSEPTLAVSPDAGANAAAASGGEEEPEGLPPLLDPAGPEAHALEIMRLQLVDLDVARLLAQDAGRPGAERYPPPPLPRVGVLAPEQVLQALVEMPDAERHSVLTTMHDDPGVTFRRDLSGGLAAMRDDAYTWGEDVAAQRPARSRTSPRDEDSQEDEDDNPMPPLERVADDNPMPPLERVADGPSPSAAHAQQNMRHPLPPLLAPQAADGARGRAQPRLDIDGTLLDNPHVWPMLDALPNQPPRLNDHLPRVGVRSRSVPLSAIAPHARAWPGNASGTVPRPWQLPPAPAPRKKWALPAGKTLREWVEERETELGIDTAEGSTGDVVLLVPAPPHAGAHYSDVD